MVRTYYTLKVVEYVVRVVRFFVPWMVRTVLFVLGLAATSVFTFWGGVPTMVARIANTWLDRAVVAGFPTQWDRQLYYALWVLGFVTIVIGWVILSYITVWLIGFIL